MECALGEQAVFIGTKGRLTLEPAHAPTQLTIWINNRPDSYPGAYHGLYVPEDATVVKYSLLDPVTRGVGQPAGYNFPNSSGFTFQVGHRRLAPAPPRTQCPVNWLTHLSHVFISRPKRCTDAWPLEC